MGSINLPTRVIAGITVVDTPLVRAAQNLARAHSDDMTYRTLTSQPRPFEATIHIWVEYPRTCLLTVRFTKYRPCDEELAFQCIRFAKAPS